MKNKVTKYFRIFLGTILIALLSATVFFLGKGIWLAKKESPNIVSHEVVETKQTKEELAKKTEEILKEFEKDPQEGANRTVADRVYELDKPSVKVEDVVSEKALSMINFADEFAEKENGKRITAQTLLALVSLLQENTPRKTVYIYYHNEQGIYLDKKTKTAFVPLELFSGQKSFINFELQKVDNEWKINPYSIVNLIQLSNELTSKDKNNEKN